MPLAISYIRFSSKKQEEGDSLRRQRKLASDWVAKNPDYTLSDIRYEDLGLSASKGHHLNGNLGKILEAVESGAIPAGSVILVETLDRFSRLTAIKTLNMLQEVIEKGVDLITLTDNIRYDVKAINGNQLFMLAGAALAAHDYAKNLSNRITESFEGRAEEARAGERIKRRNPFWLTSEGRLKPVEAAVVAEVFNSFIAGVSIRELSRKHDQYFGKLTKHKTSRNRANSSSVRKLLNNIAVCGHWQRYKIHEQKQPDGTIKQVREPLELIRNVFDPAIEEVVFHQAQRMMVRQEGASNASKNALVGLVVCASCGGNYAKRNANAKSASASMSCYTRMTDKTACANSKSYPLPVLGAVFFETMHGYVAASLQQTQLSVTERAKILLEAKIEENMAKRQRLASFITDGDDPVMSDRYNQLKLEHKGLQAELEALPVDGEAGHIAIGELYKKINDNPLALSKLLQLNGYRIICDPDGHMLVGADVFTYVGYSRKGKTFLIHNDRIGTFTSDERGQPQGMGMTEEDLAEYDAMNRQYQPDIDEEEHPNPPAISWGGTM